MSTFYGFLHPHHVSLTRQPQILHTIFQSFADNIDPYHKYDHMPPHKGFSAPRFNVTETEINYLLDGELPGVGEKTSINVTWLQNQVLVIDGAISSIDGNAAMDSVQADILVKKHMKAPVPLAGKPQVEATADEPTTAFPRRLLHERHVGPFQRSFTFPGEVDEGHMKASLKDGLLSIVIPKKLHSITLDRRVYVQ